MMGRGVCWVRFGDGMKGTCFDLFSSKLKKFHLPPQSIHIIHVDCVSESFYSVESRYTTPLPYDRDLLHANMHTRINNDRKTCFNGIPVSEIIISFRLPDLRSCCSINLHLQFNVNGFQGEMESRDGDSRKQFQSAKAKSFFVLHVY